MASMAATGQLFALRPNSSSHSKSSFSTAFRSPTRCYLTSADRRDLLSSATHGRRKCPLSSFPSFSQNPNSSSNSTPKTLIPINSKNLILFGASSVFSSALFAFAVISGGGGGAGGGRGPNGFWSRLFSRSAMAKEGEESKGWNSHGLPEGIVVQLNKLSGFKKYKISEILFFDKRRCATISSGDSFFEMFMIKPGSVRTKSEIQKELETLTTSGIIEKVELEVNTKPDGTIGIKVLFLESTWQAADQFTCRNVGLMVPPKPIQMDPYLTEKEHIEFLRRTGRDYKRRMDRARPCMLPSGIEYEIMGMMRDRGKVSARLLQRIRDKVVKWYHENGYIMAQVVNFGNLNTREVVCEVVEGDVTKLVVQFQDKLGNVCEGNTQLKVVMREIPKELRPGHVFNIEAGKRALRAIHALGLFANIEVNPLQDEKKEGGIIVEINLKEIEQRSADVNTEWSIIPGRGGRPTLASIQPGGTVLFEHRNLKGLNRSILGSMTASNFFNPQDDLSFKIEYVHPYVDGMDDPRNRAFHGSCFNSRKLSPVFVSGPESDEIPPVWIDRAGIKATITENFTRQSKLTYGIVTEEITTRDESSQITSSGQRVLPNGGTSSDGPPTTLSGTGIDRIAFAQANITRDNTKFVNGALVGERNIFQLDQGFGIGSGFPFFNRHQLTLTRFIQLKQAEEGEGKPQPPVLVLHGRYGGCIGDLPCYDAFALGGPFSVRGYSMGEIGCARNILELAIELRIPVNNKQVYAFAEHGNDLGSSKDLKGNPTMAYRRAGCGSSYGVGVKFGQLRAEYAVDHNSGKGSWFIQFGERF